MAEKTQSLRALIQDRKSKQSRPIYRHPFTLIPELYADRTELERALEELPKRKEFADEGQRPRMTPEDGRRADLDRQLADLDAQIAQATVVAVFKALSADKAAEKIAEWDKANLPPLDKARATMIECFESFDTDEDLGVDDLKDLLPTLTQGETYDVSNTLMDLSAGAIDVPKSVRQSLSSRKSGATSKPA